MWWKGEGRGKGEGRWVGEVGKGEGWGKREAEEGLVREKGREVGDGRGRLGKGER